MTDLHYGDSVHPPNVVLVSSNPSSPGHDNQAHNTTCSPLSTAPNSPCRVSFDDDDEEDDKDEIKPEEIERLLNTPARTKHEVPFDEGKAATSTPKPAIVTTNDPLLGNPNLHKSPLPTTQTTTSTDEDPDSATSNPTVPVVSPSTFEIEEDIDAYVEEEEDEEDEIDLHNMPEDSYDGDEKKVDDSTQTPPTRSPTYAGYLRNYQFQPNEASNDNLDSDVPNSYHEMMPSSPSEEEASVPDDEQTAAQREKDAIEATRSGEVSPDNNHNTDPTTEKEEDREEDTSIRNDSSPMKEALQSAEREVQEMERRVQQMIAERRQSSIVRSQQRLFPSAEGGDEIMRASSNEYHENGEVDGEPPSLSPTRRLGESPTDAHSSLGSGESSYYYDGSVMESPGVSDLNSSTLNTTSASSVSNGLLSSRSSGNVTRDLGREYYAQLESSSVEGRSREEPPLTMTMSMSMKTSPVDEKPPTSPFEAFTSRFDHEAQNGAFAKALTGTSKAFNQMSEDVTSFFVGKNEQAPLSSSKSSRAMSLAKKRSSKMPSSLASPSHDSDATPLLANLSPSKSGGRVHAQQEADLLYQKPSANLAKARSLVSGRQSTSNVYGVGIESQQEGTKQRAHRVVHKRERELQQLSSTQRPRSSNNSDASLNLPMPPALMRIAEMMEGLGVTGSEESTSRGSSDVPNESMDWSGSVSQLMEEYQNAITESLRNLSMEEIEGLAANDNNMSDHHAHRGSAMDRKIRTGASVPTSRSSNGLDEKDLYQRELDCVADVTFDACLVMPDLDHPPIMTTRNSSTAHNNRDYSRDRFLYDKDIEMQYREGHNGEHLAVLEEEDSEHQERAAFAKQLSEKLLNLGPNTSSDTDGSSQEFESPVKALNSSAKDNSFESSKGSSSAMSPPKRSKLPGVRKDAMDEDNGNTGSLFVSAFSRNGEISTSEQQSFESSGSNSQDISPERLRSSGKLTNQPPKEAGASRDIPLQKPIMVESIDNEIGIAKGDVMLSLLCDNSFQASKEKPDSWGWRVREAIWRSREMRTTIFGAQGKANKDCDEQETARRASLPVDVDDVRVVGGIQNVASIEEKALAHLEQDEFEQALELYEDIIFNYYSFFEQVLAMRDEKASEDVSMELANFKPYIGASLHNLGVIHMLKGDYEDAFSFFKRAVDNRRACLGEAHTDCITSLVRMSMCRFAMDSFAEAHTNLELALALAGSKAKTTNDYCQLGEVLNNLGCLSYMCGQPTKAMKLFRESLDVQLAVLNSTLYGGSKYAAHTATLSISITRGNIGFLALVLKDVSSGILALESALREQRLLLTGAHVTLVSTMDHLAVANLLEGRTQKAIKMLRRIYELQKASHGPDDPRCHATRQKILTIRGQQGRETDETSPDRIQGQKSQRRDEQQKLRNSDGSKPPSRSQLGTEMTRQGSENSNGLSRKSNSEEDVGSSRCTGSNNNGSSNKVGSVFKAIRSSLVRKKA